MLPSLAIIENSARYDVLSQGQKLNSRELNSLLSRCPGTCSLQVSRPTALEVVLQAGFGGVPTDAVDQHLREIQPSLQYALRAQATHQTTSKDGASMPPVKLSVRKPM